MITTEVIAEPSSEAGAVLQLLLNAPSLSQYYHFDVRPQRKPLRIRNQTATIINPGEVTVGGEAIEISRDEGPNSLDITNFLVEDEHARIAFAFRVEGIRGSASLSKQQGAWRLDEINVAEH